MTADSRTQDVSIEYCDLVGLNKRFHRLCYLGFCASIVVRATKLALGCAFTRIIHSSRQNRIATNALCDKPRMPAGAADRNDASMLA